MKFSRSLALALPALGSARTLQSRSTVDCSYTTPAGSGETCDSFASEWSITVAQLVSYNPGLKCPGNLVAGQNYCVVGTVVTSTSTTSTSSKPTTTTIPTTSSAPYQPQQSGLASNCNKYYLVASGDSCGSIESKFAITAAEFGAWNPSINSQCSNLLSGYYVCVNVPGATHTSSAPTTTAPSNGITTPTPVQSGMTTNCNGFYLVKDGDSCSAIASKYSISLSQFYSWNPAVGNSCNGLWVGYNVCVRVIGQTATPTTTTSGNGISTPTPIQSGMASNCNRFHKVVSGDTCSSIASGSNIPLSKFYSWNPAVGSSCGSLWTDYYVCVDVVGYTPPTTTKGNGVTTPTPYEPGMVGNCKSFYYVRSGDTCQSISSQKGVSVSNIEKWNPKVGSACTDLYANAYICIGVM